MARNYAGIFPPDCCVPKAPPWQVKVGRKARASVAFVISRRALLGGQVRENYGSAFVAGQRHARLVTCAHVVAGCHEVTCLFPGDEVERPCAVVACDPLADLALLDLEGPQLCPPSLPLARGLPEEGEPLLAVGHPLGLRWSLTAGVVSALGRRVDTPDGAALDCFQADCALHPGSSGCPVLTERCEVAGVAAAVHSGGEGSLGFCLPAPAVSAFLRRHARRP